MPDQGPITLPGAVNKGKPSSTWVNPLDPGPSTSTLPPKPASATTSAGVKRSRDSISPMGDSRVPTHGRSGGGRGLVLPRHGRRSPSPQTYSGSRQPSKRHHDEMRSGDGRPRHSEQSEWDDGRSGYPYRPDDRPAHFRDDGFTGSGSAYRAKYDSYQPSSHGSRSDHHGDRYTHRSHGYTESRRDYGDSRDDRYHSDHRSRQEPGELREDDDHAHYRVHVPRSPRGQDQRRATSYHRRTRSRSRSRSPRRRKPEAEEGEIAEDEVPEPKAIHTLSQEPRTTGTSTLPANRQPSDSGSSYQPIKIKNRPTKRASEVSVSTTISTDQPVNGNNKSVDHDPTIPPPPPPPPADDRPPTPPDLPPTPPPPSSRPPTPPPPKRPPTPSPEPLRDTARSTPTGPSSSSQPSRAPHNRASDLTKSQAKYDEHGDRIDGKTSAPHAPDRNLLNPITRPSTPAVKGDATPRADTPSKMFRLPTLAQEMDSLGKSFFGTTTLAAYDLGDKLGEGTFG